MVSSSEQAEVGWSLRLEQYRGAGERRRGGASMLRNQTIGIEAWRCRDRPLFDAECARFRLNETPADLYVLLAAVVFAQQRAPIGTPHVNLGQLVEGVAIIDPFG